MNLEQYIERIELVKQMIDIEKKYFGNTERIEELLSELEDLENGYEEFYKINNLIDKLAE